METPAILGVPNRFKYGIDIEVKSRRFIPTPVPAARLLTSAGCV